MEHNSLIPALDRYLKERKSSDLAQAAGIVTVWDFNTALGNTMVERFESLHVKIAEATAVAIRHGAAGYFWILTSPEVATMIEGTRNFKTTAESQEYIPMGVSDTMCVGTLDKRWRLYVEPHMSSNYMVIGCDPHTNPKHIARISVANYII